MRTFAVFCVLWSLWSTESVGHWLWMISSGATLDVGGLVLLGSLLAALFLLGGWNWDAGLPVGARWLGGEAGNRRRRLSTLGVLFVISVPAADVTMPQSLAGSLAGLRDNRLNARDAALQHRGYYEQLEVRERIGGPSDPAALRPPDWRDVGSLGVIRETMTPETRELVPSMSVDWNGHIFSTNAFGMRDAPYEVNKPAGVLRIALLGPSHVMGNGVGDGETFESIVEARLNAEVGVGGRRVEILNFAVDGFSVPQQLESLEARVLAFAPDVVIATHYQQSRTMTARYLVKLQTRGIEPSDPALRQAVADAGLMEPMAAGLPVPFVTLRAAARGAGIPARMPTAEVEGRAYLAAAGVLRVSLLRFGEVTRAAGAVPILLVLDDVLDGVDRGLIDEPGIQQAGVPVIDLLDVYPAADRDRLRVAPWDNHPNTEGHRLIAERLYPELRAILQTLPQTTETSPSPGR
jgi:hypothetical protein